MKKTFREGEERSLRTTKVAGLLHFVRNDDLLPVIASIPKQLAFSVAGLEHY